MKKTVTIFLINSLLQNKIKRKRKNNSGHKKKTKISWFEHVLQETSRTLDFFQISFCSSFVEIYFILWFYLLCTHSPSRLSLPWLVWIWGGKKILNIQNHKMTILCKFSLTISTMYQNRSFLLQSPSLCFALICISTKSFS